MIFSVLCRDYQWAEKAANVAETHDGEVIAIHREHNEANIERQGFPLRVWIRGDALVQDRVTSVLEGHYA